MGCSSSFQKIIGIEAGHTVFSHPLKSQMFGTLPFKTNFHMRNWFLGSLDPLLIVIHCCKVI